jgi:hypothetical protein
VQMRFIGNFEAFRGESFAQLVRDSISCAHDCGNRSMSAARQYQVRS